MSRRRIRLSRTAATPMRAALAAALSLGLAACTGDGAASGHGDWRAQIDTIGDTVTVRTLSGSAWGVVELVPEVRIGAIDGEDHEIFGHVTGLTVDGEGSVYVYDSQVFAVRKYDAEGRYLGTFGRKGGGPGEIENSDGGIVALADGRVVLRDPGNARFSVFGWDLEYIESWPARGGAFTSLPLMRGEEGHFFGTDFAGGVVEFGPDGAEVDTLALPSSGVSVPTVSAQREGASQTWAVPFSPRSVWALRGDGAFVTGHGDRYVIDSPQPGGGVLRVARDVEAASATPEERQAEEARVIRAMRNLDPNWRWNGPAIPSIKPLIGSILIGEDERLWVLRPQPGERVPEDELDPPPAGQEAVPQFRERPVFDVFEADGRYLGEVVAPHGFNASYPRPVIGREHVWAVATDALGVQYVVKYRIDHPL